MGTMAREEPFDRWGWRNEDAPLFLFDLAILVAGAEQDTIETFLRREYPLDLLKDSEDAADYVDRVVPEYGIITWRDPLFLCDDNWHVVFNVREIIPKSKDEHAFTKPGFTKLPKHQNTHQHRFHNRTHTQARQLYGSPITRRK